MLKRLIVLGIALVLTSCAAKSSRIDKENPNTMLMKQKNELTKKGIIAEISSGVSRDIQMSREKVEQSCRAGIVRAMEAKVQSLTKQFKEEAGEEFIEHFQSTSKTVASRVLNGTTLTDFQYIEKEEGKYEGWGLMIIDPKLYRDALAEEMKANQAMKARFMASKAYDELNKEAAAFDEFKKANTPGASAE